MRFKVFLIAIFSLPALSYPHVLVVSNPREHGLQLHSDFLKRDLEIPPKGTMEIVVLEQNDWRFRYATGAMGIFVWRLDVSLSEVLDKCKGEIGELWNNDIVHICSLTLEQNPNTQPLWPEYSLEISAIRNSSVLASKLSLHLEDLLPFNGVVYALKASLLLERMKE